LKPLLTCLLNTVLYGIVLPIAVYAIADTAIIYSCKYYWGEEYLKGDSGFKLGIWVTFYFITLTLYYYLFAFISFGFDHKLRNMLDLGSVIYLKKNAPYPVIVDPSHAMGNSQYVIQASLAAIAAGADGLIVEVHPNPEMAMSDGQQSLSLPLYSELVEKCSKLSLVLNKKLQV